MKPKPVWLLALGLVVLCGWMSFNLIKTTKAETLIGVQSGALLLYQAPLPALHWGDLNQFGDLGVQVQSSNFVDLATTNVLETVRFSDMSYTQLQPGLFLVVLNGQRVFIFTDPFEPVLLKPQAALSFNSDWVVLQRSSLLPKDWPEPRQGWLLLGAQISESLKQQSLDTKKPVVRPNNQGTVWLKKTPETNWEVTKP